MSEFEEVILHIGTHKTGSTAIQHWCLNNVDTLKQSGILYPQGKLERWGGHHAVAWALGVKHPFKDSALNIESELNKLKELKVPRLLISSEDLEFLSIDGIVRLRKLLPAKRYRVIVVLRNIIDYLFADYQQNVRMSSSRYKRSLEEFFIEANFYHRANYLITAEKWESVFGIESLSLICYQSARSNGLIPKVLSAAEIHDVQIESNEQRTNQSLDPISVEIIRRMNCRISVEEEKRQLMISKLYQLEKTKRKKVAYLEVDVSQKILENLSHPMTKLSSKFNFDISQTIINTQISLSTYSDQDVEERLYDLSTML